MFTLFSPKRLVLELVAMTAIAASAQDKSAPAMTLVVDETQGTRRIAFVHEEIRVRPGAVTLAYPKWIPGEHVLLRGSPGIHEPSDGSAV
jgi:hypothetical protein